MADRFIDQDETQIYGPYTSRRIRTRIIGLSPAFDPALLYLADQLDVATAAVNNAVDDARGHDARLRRGVQQKTPLLRQALGCSAASASTSMPTHPAPSIARSSSPPAAWAGERPRCCSGSRTSPASCKIRNRA